MLKMAGKTKMTEQNQKQSNIDNHSKSQFEAMIQQAMKEGGLQLTAMKGFGKTRLLFSMAQSIRNFSNSKVYIFDGSLAWLYGFSKIPVFQCVLFYFVRGFDILRNYVSLLDCEGFDFRS